MEKPGEAPGESQGGNFTESGHFSTSLVQRPEWRGVGQRQRYWSFAEPQGELKTLGTPGWPSHRGDGSVHAEPQPLALPDLV